MFKILEKPTANDLLKMFEEYDTDTLRALVDKNGDIYAWPFDMAMHAEVKKRLGLGDDFEHVIIAKEDMAPPGKRAAERSG